MTDASLTAESQAPLPPPERSAKAERNRAQRRRAETRFRLYGLAAVLTAGAFLCAILGDILIKAWPAFTQSKMALDVPVTADLVDAANVKSGDFEGLIRNALRAQFPAVTSRADKKALDSIVSSSAGDELRSAVIADPGLIGKSAKISGLLSSDADLFVKGISTPAAIVPGGGVAKLNWAESAAAIAFESGALTNVFHRLGSEKAESVTLDAASPSLLIALNGGVIKVAKASSDRAEGEILVPLLSTDTSTGMPWKAILLGTPEGSRKITDKEAAFVALLQEKGLVKQTPNWTFLTQGDSREPEQAGIFGALIGSALTMLVTLGLCLPLGVGAAVYLEEFAPKNSFTHLIEVNINNLAAVPSIVFGLLGLAIFLNFAGLPRSSSLVGGLVLALLVLPTIIIASRAALKSVPSSIADAALALGATHQQAVFHHVLPQAIPGIMTGTIIGMAHALGETAPLLMIGMVAFIADVPHTVNQAATVLPVQIFLWSDLPEVGFQARTAAAIVILLLFLMAMNGLAIFVRKKFERRW